MRFSDFPFLRYLPFFILGILSNSYFHISWSIGLLILGVLWGAYWLLLFLKSKGSTFLQSSLAYLILVILGFWISSFQEEVKRTPHRLQESKGYFAKALRYDIPKPNSRENLLEVIAYRDSLGWNRASNKVILYHQAELKPGQLLFVGQSPEQIDPPTFPGEFDYRAFLARKGVHYRQFVRKGPTILGIEAYNSMEFWILNLRKSLSQVLEKFMEIPESRQIASALLLGEKEALDREVRRAYSETGTMHILAVSGLHVGIIYAILLFPLKRVKTKSRIRKGNLLGVILLIWIYALLTGFSPSVIRASFMFTLFSLGQMRERKPSIWNILAFSALVMIAINPEVMYEVGFQLSYTAVAGIVGLQPLIVRWWEPQSRVLEYFWQLAAVSLAAQLATFPLTLYYFHIFPTYFLLVNLVIIPMAFVAMILGLGLLSLSWIPGVGTGLGYVLDHWILSQNSVNSFFQNLPGGVQERLTISLFAMVSVWGMLLIWGNWEWGNRRRLMYFAAILLGLWRLEALVWEISKPKDEILIFSKGGKTLIQSQVGSHYLVWNQDFPPEQISFSLDPLRIQQGIPKMPEILRGISTETGVCFPGLGFSYSLQQKEILLDSESNFQIRKFGN
ncbi:ComEC/Rec2 family competence protein [Algoriphagus mannitolivorans]|uniref:ComEC/Rec2 family competence protein n=1 Tax=Algoriphagus mannitolivorans TaxID=226504 RepID=UPI0006842B80|nr:ComEC/Rec2 family competence protein [Algoriphagus mannitolivorans]